MNALFKKPIGLFILLIALGRANEVRAQSFKTLYNFSDAEGRPATGLLLFSNTFYGAAGGISGNVFAFDTSGVGFTNLYSFTATSHSGYPDGTNDDGASPSGLILSGNTLYGTASLGGSSGRGTIFTINTDGSGFKVLYTFTAGTGSFPTIINADGAFPSGLVLSENTLYGTTSLGGSSGNGTLFKLNAEGTGFQVLHSFTAINPSSYPPNNGDGIHPNAGVAISGTTLYGTAPQGGSAGNGTLFKIGTDGSGFSVLHAFTSVDSANSNTDGANPAKLILAGNNLYGTASCGGTMGIGTVFSIDTNGAVFTTLHSFIDSDGSYPENGLILSGTTLYGTTVLGGGSIGNGTVFSLKTDGTAFSVLHIFSKDFCPDVCVVGTNSDGARPQGDLVLSGNTLYGTASAGGVAYDGTMFSIGLLPTLTLTRSGSTVVMSWPTNFTGFTLQSAANLSSPVWTTNLPPPVVVSGLNTVSNPISGTQQYFRLSQ